MVLEYFSYMVNITKLRATVFDFNINFEKFYQYENKFDVYKSNKNLLKEFEHGHLVDFYF